MKKELVISSYTEDLLWINEIDSSVKLYVMSMTHEFFPLIFERIAPYIKNNID